MDLKNYQTDSYFKKDIRGKEQRFYCIDVIHSITPPQTV